MMHPPASRRPQVHRPPMRLAAATMLGAMAASGTALHAQTATTAPVRFETFAARHESTNSRTLGGISLSVQSGVFGIRASGAVAGLNVDDGFGSQPSRYCSRYGCRNVGGYGSGSSLSADAWSADADLIAEPFRTAPAFRQLLIGFSPYAFVGIGRYADKGSNTLAGDTTLTVWSYGAGVHHDLAGRLGFSAEGRIRRSFENDVQLGSTHRSAIQYRVGLSFGLGGGTKRRRSSANNPVIVSRRPVGGARPAPKPVPAPAPAPVPSAPTEVVVVPADLDASAIVPLLIDEADALANTRWTEGGTTPASGFDAGGFVQYVFAQQHVAVPRRVSELAATGISVPTRAGLLRAGDLLFFSNDGTTPDHVAIYVGHDRFIHASASASVVGYDVLGEGPRGTWFAEHLVSARRVLGSQAPASRIQSPSLSPSGRPDRAPRPAGGR